MKERCAHSAEARDPAAPAAGLLCSPRAWSHHTVPLRRVHLSPVPDGTQRLLPWGISDMIR